MFSYNKLKNGNGVINLWALLTLFRYYMVNSLFGSVRWIFRALTNKTASLATTKRSCEADDGGKGSCLLEEALQCIFVQTIFEQLYIIKM